jgi:hypothetical protein
VSARPFAFFLTMVMVLAGCAHEMIEPGHRALMFDPGAGGLQHEVLQPGYVKLPCGFLGTSCAHLDDYDVTYSTRRAELAVRSADGLDLTVRVAVIYRPIVAELYQLDTELGPNYYEEVIGPEFEAATRGVLAGESAIGLEKRSERVEDEIETALRRRVAGKHVEISSVILEKTTFARATS